MIGEREKNTAFYTHEKVVMDQLTGEIISAETETIAKTSSEPDFVKVYYETMLAFNQIHNVPTTFVLSMSKYLEWTNDASPQYITLTKRVKELMMQECQVSLPQLNRYIRQSVDSGLLFRTEYRGTYEVNPCMIAKGRWDSIRKLQTRFDFKEGRWIRIIEEDKKPLPLNIG